MYWTNFRNYFTIRKLFTCRWWICTSFSNLSRVLPWQPNNFAVMEVNWYYVNSLHFGRWSTVLFRYYLLGGDTVAPSGLLARLCHAFLVFLLWAKLSQYLQDRFSRSFRLMEGIFVNFLDHVQLFRLVKGRWHGKQFSVVPDLFAPSQSISRSAGPIFTIIVPYSRYWWSIRPSFSDILRNVAMATNLVTTSGSAMTEEQRDALVSRNSATTKYPYRVALFAWSYV